MGRSTKRKKARQQKRKRDRGRPSKTVPPPKREPPARLMVDELPVGNRADNAARLLDACLVACPVLFAVPRRADRPGVIEDPHRAVCPSCGQMVQGAANRGCPRQLAIPKALMLLLPKDALHGDASALV